MPKASEDMRPTAFATPLVLAVFAVVAAMLAGCSGTAPEDPAAPHVHYVTIPRPVNATRWEPCMGFAGNADLTGVGLHGQLGQERHASVVDAGAHLELPEGVAAIVLDLWWENGAATSIRSRVTGPDGTVVESQPHAAATAGEPVRLEILRPAPGKWEWTGVADPVAAGVVLHYNEGLYFEDPATMDYGCNLARDTPRH